MIFKLQNGVPVGSLLFINALCRTALLIIIFFHDVQKRVLKSAIRQSRGGIQCGKRRAASPRSMKPSLRHAPIRYPALINLNR